MVRARAAREKINPAQAALLDRLAEILGVADEPFGDDQPDRPLHGLRVGAQRALASARSQTLEGRVMFESLRP